MACLPNDSFQILFQIVCSGSGSSSGSGCYPDTASIFWILVIVKKNAMILLKIVLSSAIVIVKKTP